MSSSGGLVFDTRFFIEHYYSRDEKVREKTREMIRCSRNRFVSAVAVHEVYRLSLEREGRETAVLRTTLLAKDFKVVALDTEVAKDSAEFRHKYRLCLADSVIAATAVRLRGDCVSDDPHFKKVKEIRTRWL